MFALYDGSIIHVDGMTSSFVGNEATENGGMSHGEQSIKQSSPISSSIELQEVYVSTPYPQPDRYHSTV